MAGFASTVGWPMGVALVQLLGWRATALCYAAMQVCINLPLILLLVPRPGPPPPVPAAAATNQPAPRSTYLAYTLLAIFFSVRAGISAVISVHVLRLLQGVGLTAAVAVGVAALIGP